MSVTIPRGLTLLAVHQAVSGPTPAEATHASLYEITVTVVYQR